MRSQLLASLTSKLVAGVAATTLAAGSAGALAMTTINAEENLGAVTCDVVDTIDEGTTTDEVVAEESAAAAESEQLQAAEEGAVEVCPDDGSGATPEATPDAGDGTDASAGAGEEDAVDPAEAEAEGSEAEGGDALDDELEEAAPVTIEAAADCADGKYPEGYSNFGEQVEAVRECGYKGGVSQLAHEKNAERKAGEEVEDPAEEGSEDAASEEGVEDPAEEEGAEVTIESSDAPRSHGKGHAKKK